MHPFKTIKKSDSDEEIFILEDIENHSRSQPTPITPNPLLQKKNDDDTYDDSTKTTNTTTNTTTKTTTNTINTNTTKTTTNTTTKTVTRED